MIGINKLWVTLEEKGTGLSLVHKLTYACSKKSINITLIEWSEPESKPL